MENSKDLKGQKPSYETHNDGSKGAPALKETRKTGENKAGSAFLQNKIKDSEKGSN